MASQSFNLIGQEEEHELVAFETRQSRGPTPLPRPNSRMEEMLSQLIISQAEANKSLEAKMSSTDDKVSQMAYKQIEQVTEISDLVDRISTVERSLQGSPFTGSDPTRRSPTPSGHALMASAPYTLALTTPSSLALERSKTAKSSDPLPPIAAPIRRSLRLKMKQNSSLHRADSRFLNSPVEDEEEEEEVGFRPLEVIGRPIDKGSVNTTQGQRWNVVEVGENLGQERIIESHTVGPEVQGIQNPVEALSPVERLGVAPGVSAGLPPQKYHIIMGGSSLTFSEHITNLPLIILYITNVPLSLNSGISGQWRRQGWCCGILWCEACAYTDAFYREQRLDRVLDSLHFRSYSVGFYYSFLA